MTIAGQTLLRKRDGGKKQYGFAIYVCSIVTWDDSNGELIDAVERNRILQNVVAYMEGHGRFVELA